MPGLMDLVAYPATYTLNCILGHPTSSFFPASTIKKQAPHIQSLFLSIYEVKSTKLSNPLLLL